MFICCFVVTKNILYYFFFFVKYVRIFFIFFYGLVIKRSPNDTKASVKVPLALSHRKPR